MLRLIATRLLLSIPLLVAVTLLTFVFNSLAPGDIARTMLQGEGSEEQYQVSVTVNGCGMPCRAISALCAPVM